MCLTLFNLTCMGWKLAVSLLILVPLCSSWYYYALEKCGLLIFTNNFGLFYPKYWQKNVSVQLILFSDTLDEKGQRYLWTFAKTFFFLKQNIWRVFYNNYNGTSIGRITGHFQWHTSQIKKIAGKSLV